MAVLVQNLTNTLISIGDLSPVGGSDFLPYEIKDLEKWYTRSEIDASVVLRGHINDGRMSRIDTGTPTDPLSQIATDSVLVKENTTTKFTYVQPPSPSQGEVETAKEFPTGSTVGDPAKLTTFSYGDAMFPKKATLVVVTDSTVQASDLLP